MKLDTQPAIDNDLITLARQLNNTSLHPEKQAALIIAQELRYTKRDIVDHLGEVIGRLDALVTIQANR
jgi:hypothetical protein